jgi:hypothetical protein
LPESASAAKAMGESINVKNITLVFIMSVSFD